VHLTWAVGREQTGQGRVRGGNGSENLDWKAARTPPCSVRTGGKAELGMVWWRWMSVVGGVEVIEDGTQGGDCLREKLGASHAPGGSTTEQMWFESSKSAVAPLHGIS